MPDWHWHCTVETNLPARQVLNLCDSCTSEEGQNWRPQGHLGVIGSSLVSTDFQVHPASYAGAQESPIRVRPLVHLAQELVNEGPKGCSMGGKLTCSLQFYGLGLSEKLFMTQWHSNVSGLFLHPFLLHTWDFILRWMNFILLLSVNIPFICLILGVVEGAPYFNVLGFGEWITIITSWLCRFESDAFWNFAFGGNLTFAAFSQMSHISFTAYSYMQLYTMTLWSRSESLLPFLKRFIY